MSNRIVWFGLGFILVALLACAPKTVPVANEKVQQAMAIPDVKVGWEAEWAKILEGANKEGKVVVFGQAEPVTRDGFVKGFKKAYPDITLEYTGMGGAALGAKIAAERRAGLYTVDLDIHGTTTALTALRQFAIPIKPLLILPEVKDPKYWWGGKLDFSDSAEEINLVMVINISPRVGINTDLVNPQELTSYWDMTKPKWKGKIIAHDPRYAGTGLANATFWYLTPGLGMDFIKALAANQPVLSQDRRLIVESVARGKYAIAIGPAEAFVDEFADLGTPIRWSNTLKEGTYLSAGWGSVVAMDKAPNPNARTVFLNWLLGKEGQTILATTTGYASRRLDVSTDHLRPYALPDPKINYQPNYKEQYVILKDEITPLMVEMFR